MVVLDELQRLGVVTSTQRDELLVDIQRRLPGSLEFLMVPQLGAGTDSPRLAKLYLALNEVCNIYDAKGKVENFGLIRGHYSNLSRAGEDG